MDTAPCGFVAFADDGTILEINHTLLDLLGHPKLDLLGWHVEKLFPPGGRIFYHTYLFPMLKVQGHVEEIYAALRTKDGVEIPVLLNGVRRERDGSFVSDCVCVKLIQRHEYEEQLLAARRQAEESNAAKAKFLSMMSHDLRSPLTTIDGNAQLLASGGDGPLTKEQLESVQAIREACRMQMAMVNDILEFARLDSGHASVRPRAVRVAEVVARAEGLVRLQMSDAGLHFATSCDGPGEVMADPDRLQQILLNLLTNAIKFTPPGGQIAVFCQCAEDRVRIAVRDSGIGIEPDHLQRIFAPFVQLDITTSAVRAAASRGVGLGLAISRDLARAMDGDVTASSTPGSGSTFTVELPSARSGIAAAAASE